MRKRSKRKEKKKLTDTGLLEIPWILDVKGFSDGYWTKKIDIISINFWYKCISTIDC
jgi:hypothetical protein